MWDVIVVGTGPAGSMAAYELAKGGCRTLMIEKEKLPRYKTCGGGLVQRGMNALPFSISEVIERQITAAQLTNNFRNAVLIQKPVPMVSMTMRSELDHYMTRKALEAGAELRENVRVESVSENDSGIECRSSSGCMNSSFVIAADGVNSSVARSLKWSPPLCGVALEVEVRLKSNYENSNRMDFDFNVLPDGYGWVFPKATHLSCGVFTIQRTCPSIRKYYDRYIQRKTFAGDISDSKLSGHLIPLRPVGYRLNSARCLLTGDAAGLADPLTGEGISYAIRSGSMAAKAILNSNSNLNHYSQAIRDTLVKEIKLARFLARMLYAFPSLTYGALIRKEYFADRVLDLFAGKSTYTELAKSILLKPHKLF